MPPPDHSFTIKGGEPAVASSTNTSTQAAEGTPTSLTPELELDLENLDLEPEVDTEPEPHCLSLPQLFITTAWERITSAFGKSKLIHCLGLHLLDLPHHYKPLHHPAFASSN